MCRHTQCQPTHMIGRRCLQICHCCCVATKTLTKWWGVCCHLKRQFFNRHIMHYWLFTSLYSQPLIFSIPISYNVNVLFLVCFNILVKCTQCISIWKSRKRILSDYTGTILILSIVISEWFKRQKNKQKIFRMNLCFFRFIV